MLTYNDIKKYNTLEHFKRWKEKANGRRITWLPLKRGATLTDDSILSYYGILDATNTKEILDHGSGYIKFKTINDGGNYWNFTQRTDDYFWWIEGIGFYFPDDPVQINTESDYYAWLAAR